MSHYGIYPVLLVKVISAEMIGISLSEDSTDKDNGIRPINLQTDLASLADLIELVFAESMDSGGRAALREMRYLSKMGPGLRVLSRMNELAMGISLGFVWVVDGRLVGNVSVYPANWPADMGSAWIIANVGVHPDFQRRGIAHQLMQASMEMIRQRKGRAAILQVDYDNDTAVRLYERLGFIQERAWTTWQRRGSSRMPPALPPQAENLYIRHRRRGEWREEMALAQRLRPAERGGLGWLRPFHVSFFRKPLMKKLGDWLNLRGTERLVIRPGEDAQLRASVWVDNALAGKTRLTLLIDPLMQGIYDEALLNYVIRRFGRSTLLIEHPRDDDAMRETLSRYQFMPQRNVIHMRWDVR